MSFEQKQYWLKGVEFERERIINALDELETIADRIASCEDCSDNCYKCLAIAHGQKTTIQALRNAIKGEQE